MRDIAVRRDIADLILEALDIARSRKFGHHQTQAFILDILAAERPDISLSDARVLTARTWRRLAGIVVPAPGMGD
jgi:hypothetical protein